MKVSVSNPRRLIQVVAALFLATHVASVAPSLEDIDSINFALGLRDFDPSKHQPHPPGSPVYIALGRATLVLVTTVRPGLDQTTAEALALGLWSLIAGVVAILAAGRLFALVAPERTRASFWGAAILASAPLFWLSGLRPMSDLPGLAAALAAQVLILQGLGDRRRLVYGALLSGVAAGIRLQTAWLTAPLLFVSLVAQRRAGLSWLLTRPVTACALGGLAWGVPLVADSGGVERYLAALGTQAGEDFAWVNMLWLNPTPRRLAFSVYETFVLPWGPDALAAVVAVVAVIGAVLATVRDRRALGLLLVAFGPYALLHLLFQETLTVRYALPTLVPVAWLCARALTSMGRTSSAVATALVVAVLAVSLPVGGRSPRCRIRALQHLACPASRPATVDGGANSAA
jgi:hypothetical protein